MALRVIEALAARPAVGRIGVSSDTPALVAALAELATRAGVRTALEHHPSGRSPAASVAAYVRSLAVGETAVVTTADHPLLSAEIVDWFLREALQLDADVVAGAVSEVVYRRRFPTGKRTFIRLADCAISGANLFLVRAPAAAAVADFWVHLEGARKRPWLLVSRLGARTLLRFVGGRLTLGQAVEDVSRRVHARVAVVLLPYAEAALDVDRPADLEAVEGVLRARVLENPRSAG
jgi:CTP:molybdopterin cytidylyltransferase MocA